MWRKSRGWTNSTTGVESEFVVKHTTRLDIDEEAVDTVSYRVFTPCALQTTVVVLVESRAFPDRRKNLVGHS
jgi:hypothetical protein